MPTTSSSASAYASAADMLLRYDARSIGDLCTRTDPPVRVTPTNLLTDTVLAEALKDASGMVEAAVMTGQQHSPAALAALAASDTVGARFLKRLVCDLTMGLLFLGRPDRTGEVPASYVRAEEVLQEIRSGQQVFGLLDQQEAAGAAKVTVETPSQVEDRRGVVFTAGRYFGRRNNRLGSP